MAVELGLCQSPEGCTYKATSLDHFTPVSIAKVLGWDKSQYGHRENLQPLCQPHHTEKDRSTPIKLAQVKFQQNGGTIKFGEHR